MRSLLLAFLVLGFSQTAFANSTAAQRELLIPPVVELDLEIRAVDRKEIRARLSDGSSVILRRSAIAKPLANGKTSTHRITLEEWAHVRIAKR